MSKRRYMDAAAAFPWKPRGPNGERYCRVCGNEITKPRRRTTCSTECADVVYLSSRIDGQRVRIQQRDKGICCACGCDTDKLDRILAHTKRGRRLPDAEKWARDKLAVLGFRRYGALWDMAHVRDVADGGGIRPGMTVAEILGNLRTLCTPCHKRETAARRRS